MARSHRIPRTGLAAALLLSSVWGAAPSVTFATFATFAPTAHAQTQPAPRAQAAPLLSPPIVLSSPLGTPPAGAVSAAAGSPAAAASPGIAGVLGGSGAGVHSPNSPFAPLPPRTDVVPWSVLTDISTRTVNRRLLPNFKDAQTALNGQTQRIQGFMVPLEPGERQRHFLLTSVPLTCSFCTPGGPESMVEVRTRTPVRYVMEPVVVEGRFSVLPDDPFGLYYRLSEAVGVK